MGNPVNDKAYYHYARSLGLCGRCKRADALPGMAYCLKCRTDMQHYNHARKGLPSKRKVYVTKFTVAMEAESANGRRVMRNGQTMATET